MLKLKFKDEEMIVENERNMIFQKIVKKTYFESDYVFDFIKSLIDKLNKKIEEGTFEEGEIIALLASGFFIWVEQKAMLGDWNI